MITTPSRRGLLTGLISFVAAPAIIRTGSIMPVKSTMGLNLVDHPTYEELLADISNIEKWILHKKYTFYHAINSQELELFDK